MVLTVLLAILGSGATNFYNWAISSGILFGLAFVVGGVLGLVRDSQYIAGLGVWLSEMSLAFVMSLMSGGWVSNFVTLFLTFLPAFAFGVLGFNILKSAKVR